MGEADGSEPKKPRFYDVDRFRTVVDSQASADPPRGLRLILIRLRLAVDSIGGFFSTILGITIVFLAPLAVVVGALFGLLSFLVSFLGVVTILGVFVQLKVGKSIQFGDQSFTTRLLAQLVGFTILMGIMFLVFFVILRLKIS